MLRGRRAPSVAARAELDKQRDDAAALLRAAGWHVAVARADTAVETVWAELTERPVPSGSGLPGVGVPA